jgi:hypothetical protein
MDAPPLPVTMWVMEKAKTHLLINLKDSFKCKNRREISQ